VRNYHEPRGAAITAQIGRPKTSTGLYFPRVLSNHSCGVMMQQEKQIPQPVPEIIPLAI
jgi:hypothetical protein